MNIEKLNEKELKDIKRAFTVFMTKLVNHHSINFIKRLKLNHARNLPFNEGIIYKVSLSNYDNGIFFIENIIKDNELEQIMTKKEHSKAVSKLSRREKQVIKALYVDDKDIEEIAKELDITEKTVLNTKNSALDKLRNDMEE